jgi:hypothetical protein
MKTSTRRWISWVLILSYGIGLFPVRVLADLRKSELSAERERLFQAIGLAQQLGTSSDQLNHQLMPWTRDLARRMTEAKHPDSERMTNTWLPQMERLQEVSNTLRQCKLSLGSGASVKGCELEQEPSSAAMLSLQRDLDALANAEQASERSDLAKKFYEAIIQKTRANTLALYARVSSKYSKELAQDPEQALDSIYQEVSEQGQRRLPLRRTGRHSEETRDPGAVRSIQNLSKQASEVAKKDSQIIYSIQRAISVQPRSEEARRAAREEYFKNTQRNAVILHRELSTAREFATQAQATRDLLQMRWLESEPRLELDSPQVSPVRVIDIHPVRDASYLLGQSPEKGFSSFLKPIQSQTTGPQVRAGDALPEFLRQRYRLEVQEWKGRQRDPLYQGLVAANSDEMVLREFERVYPGKGAQLAAQFVSHLDEAFKNRPRQVTAAAVLEIVRDSVDRIQVRDPDGQSVPLSKRATTIYNRAAIRAQELQSSLRQNPLTWQRSSSANVVTDGIRNVSELPAQKLQKQLQEFYSSSRELLLKIEQELSRSDPERGIKDALIRNPAVIAQVLEEHPEFAGLACALNQDLRREGSQQVEADQFWAITGAVILGGLTLLTGGAALLGTGSLVAMLGTASGAAGVTLGSISTARAVVRGNELSRQAEQARLYLSGLGMGQPGEIEQLMEQANDRFVDAILSGALTPLDVVGFYSGLKGLSAAAAFESLGRAAKGGQSLQSAVKSVATEAETFSSRLARGKARSPEYDAELSDIERVLDDAKRAAIEEAHQVGAGRQGPYSMQELREKYDTLRRAGFDVDQADVLIRSGVAGFGDRVEDSARASAARRALLGVEPGDQVSFRSWSGQSYEVTVLEAPDQMSNGFAFFKVKNQQGEVGMVALHRIDAATLRYPQLQVRRAEATRKALKQFKIGDQISFSSFSGNEYEELKLLGEPYEAFGEWLVKVKDPEGREKVLSLGRVNASSLKFSLKGSSPAPR